MKKILCKTFLSSFIVFYSIIGFALSNTQTELKSQINNKLNNMTLRQKIGQKLMLDFRYWCADNSSTPCTTDFTQMNPAIANVLQDNDIGGLILFANNAKTFKQIKTLTTAAQNSMQRVDEPNLLISTDQEGGIVTRLPSNETATFSGNMAIAAATLGKRRPHFYAYRVGKALGQQLTFVGINVDNAPDVDVNMNPKNPVINVRSFSDNPDLVYHLGKAMMIGIQSAGIAATLKHFPGHGDTSTDSHTGLPRVDHDWKQAWLIDLYPFQRIIQGAISPDMLMTAHIQFAALDDSTIWADKIGKAITVPATLSYKIQHDILRGNGIINDKDGNNPHQELNFKGVSITDALDMGAIADNFNQETAVVDAFKAGDDIALMPVEISRPSDAVNLSNLIDKIVAVVNEDTLKCIKSKNHENLLCRKDIRASVKRILLLKATLGLLDTTFPKQIEKNRHSYHRKLEANLANASVTLIKNDNKLLPLALHKGERIHILTPWGEQGDAIAQEITILQAVGKLPKILTITHDKISATTEDEQKVKVSNADIVIVGDLAKGSAPLSALVQSKLSIKDKPSPIVFPDMPIGDSTQLESIATPSLRYSEDGISDPRFAYDILSYAHTLKKPTIFLSVLSPYDLPIYRTVADAMLVGYDYYGYLETPAGNYFRGPAMQAITRTIFKDIKTGKAINTPTAKLPVNVPDPSNLISIIYPRGFGLTY